MISNITARRSILRFTSALLIASLSLLLLGPTSIATARTYSDEEIDISYVSLSKPKFGKCSFGLVSITPKRDIMGIYAQVRNSKNKVVGWHRGVLVNAPINQKTNKVFTFCNYEKEDFKGPYKLNIFIRYNPYRAPASGDTRTIEIPFKFLKKKKS